MIPVIFAFTGLLPYVPDQLADTVPGQAQWWIAGFFVGMSCCLLGQLIRFIRAAKGTGGAP